jgi:hypothetical protein
MEPTFSLLLLPWVSPRTPRAFPRYRIEQLRVPRRREGEFLIEVFERCQRLTGNVEEAV